MTAFRSSSSHEPPRLLSLVVRRHKTRPIVGDATCRLCSTLYSARPACPLGDVRLLRHKDKRATKGRNPYELWRDNRSQFELYQSGQGIDNRKTLSSPYWAVFIVNLNDETMFGGIYRVKYGGLWDKDTPMPHIAGGIQKAGGCDGYDLALNDAMCDLIGKLFIDWGPR